MRPDTRLKMELSMLDLNILFIKLWLHLFEERPKSTIVATIIFISGITAFISFAINIDEEKRKEKLMESNNYQTQINQLNDTEKNIKNLLAFVNTQKVSLRETEEALLTLKSEREKLRPLVETDRATVEAVFKAQEERTSANVWRERWIGFGLGLFASVIASLLLTAIAMLYKKYAKPELLQH